MFLMIFGHCACTRYVFIRARSVVFCCIWKGYDGKNTLEHRKHCMRLDTPTVLRLPTDRTRPRRFAIFFDLLHMPILPLHHCVHFPFRRGTPCTLLRWFCIFSASLYVCGQCMQPYRPCLNQATLLRPTLSASAFAGISCAGAPGTTRVDRREGDVGLEDGTCQRW